MNVINDLSVIWLKYMADYFFEWINLLISLLTTDNFETHGLENHVC